MDQERFVLVFAENVFKEFVTGVALPIVDPRLAAAGIEQQAQREGKITLLREIADGLRTPVFLDAEFVLAEGSDRPAVSGI
jgi:hypothetical protein